MQIWVDADACPRVIKEILYRAAERVEVRLTLVANKPLQVPRSPWIEALRVPAGFDEADHRIVELVSDGDLVVTGDIPLAAAVIDRGGHVLGPRGEELTEENIRERLAMRDLMDHLRSTGVETGGPDALGKGDRQAFANGLDRLLTRCLKRNQKS
ncbi:MAG: YaiI/YqxD family protein [Acidobacteria bacterium]|nr:YaiI/YqxD family protein [Acidobacteriota bacterium]NIM60573.1 YaiI/YqxD family protein [Acidobacteriota bacterium]NIO57900.1 YaiI/YqxD family protein [Acidobacteriota bacterium]NIQ28903.1 YaiI/YqxD family protein [Acidobacteriota bacterium]NIQ83373.1 YaiI/YqxD family protein [Acidobacteriota bacterium]